jgi:hypothetical protein
MDYLPLAPLSVPPTKHKLSQLWLVIRLDKRQHNALIYPHPSACRYGSGVILALVPNSLCCLQTVVRPIDETTPDTYWYAPVPTRVLVDYHPIAHIRIQIDAPLKPNRVSGQKPSCRRVKVAMRQ